MNCDNQSHVQRERSQYRDPYFQMSNNTAAPWKNIGATGGVEQDEKVQIWKLTEPTE